MEDNCVSGLQSLVLAFFVAHVRLQILLLNDMTLFSTCKLELPSNFWKEHPDNVVMCKMFVMREGSDPSHALSVSGYNGAHWHALQLSQQTCRLP